MISRTGFMSAYVLRVIMQHVVCHPTQLFKVISSSDFEPSCQSGFDHSLVESKSFLESEEARMLAKAVQSGGTLLVLLVTLGAYVQCWELEQLSEMKCIKDPPKTTSELNMAWLQSVDLWYYNYGSKLDMYRTAAEVLNCTLSEVKDAEFYYRACLTYTWGKDMYVEGFGKKLPVKMVPRNDGSFEWIFENTRITGVASIPFTDNESYLFFYACWEDDASSFGVISTKPKLEPQKLAEIHEYAKSLGFKEEHFTHIEYDNCNL